MVGRVLYWCDETLQQPFETGIQRVVRRLGQSLMDGGVEVIPVGWDRRTRNIKFLQPGRRLAGDAGADLGGQESAGPWLLIPELPFELAGQNIDPVQIGRAYGLRTAAWVHDLIPLKFSHDYSEPARTQFRRYYAMFATADLVFAATQYVANDLHEHLCRSGSVGPDIAVVPFAAQLGRTHRHTRKRLTRSAFEPLKLLTVATWEPRKNLPRLLKAIRAAERVAGVRIELSLVGRKGCFPEYDAEVEALVAAMPHAVHHGPVRDDELVPLYENCHAAIYPSYEEGFGLPVMEALWLGTPCLCHNGSSMAELVPGGGVIAVDMTSEEAIAGALQRLAHEPELLDRAVAEATVRPLTAWRDYTSTVVDRLSQQTNGRAGWAASRRGPGMRCRPAA